MKTIPFINPIMEGKTYVLPQLPYAYNSLDPLIDEATMHLHHDKHHAAYVAGANMALKHLDAIASGQEDASLSTHWSRQLAFHESGHILHSMMWENISPNETLEPVGELAHVIEETFGSVDHFESLFKAISMGVEGSGWGILCYDPSAKTLRILGVEKHQNLSIPSLIPLLVLDVWEHAYYLKYQNNRSAYVEAYMKLINWNDINKRYLAASQS